MSIYHVPDYNLDPPEDTRRRVYSCAICGNDIIEGEDYYDLPKLGKCCEDCVRDCKCYEAEIEEPDDGTYDSMREEELFNGEQTSFEI